MAKIEAPKRQKDIETDVDGSVVTLTFANGKSIVLDVEELSDGVRTVALTSRIVAKLIDAAAISRDPKTGKSASIEEKFAAVQSVFQMISGPAGVWSQRGEGGESSGILLQAFYRAYPAKNKGAVTEYYQKLSKEQRARWLAAPVKGAEEVYREVLSIRQERAAKLPDIDVAGELAALPDAVS